LTQPQARQPCRVAKMLAVLVGWLEMTREQILWQIVIGLFLLVVWELFRPVLRIMWARMNRPRPLSPQDRGKLTEQLAMQERELERLNHFAAHPKDLFLFSLQLMMGAFLSLIVASYMYAYRPAFLGVFIDVDILGLGLVSTLLFIVAILWGRSMSDDNVDAARKKIQMRIDDAKKKLAS
jgi:hypothetical protein